MVDQAALKTAMTLQKGYIDKGDQANLSRIQQLETTTEAQGVEIESMKESVDILETGAPFFVAAYAKGTNDSTPLFSKGNKEILKKFDFFLLDTSDNAGEYTTPVGKLMKNNLLRFVNGNFAPVVGITQAMYDECTTNAIYTKAGNGSYTESYANGAYDADAQWEIDKALIAEGQEPTTLYKKVGEEYQPVSHVLRPWETTETKYTIGIAPAHDLYLLDNVVGTSGRYWKGIFTSPRIWDGIDISKYKVARTAIGPCPTTTIGDNGVNKCRCFFYLYGAANQYCQSNPGLIPNNPFYNKDRHYPHTENMDQVGNRNLARDNNADTSKSYPFAEGGWWATNAHIIALELLAGTRYLHQANLFGSGISSNDGTNATNFYTSGGARLRVKGSADWLYKTFRDKCTPYYYKANRETVMIDLLTQYRPKEAAMESQLAASMATELGIAPTESADALNIFKFYGDTYYYMNVPGFAGLQDGDMNVKVYKVQTADVEGFNEAGEATTFEFEFVFRMSLFNGANLSGDIWAYNGGGLEMVGTRETDAITGHHVDVYLQPDQKKWHNDSIWWKNIGESWDFEKTYIKVGEYETLGDSYTLERMSNSPVRIKKASNMSQGENYYMWDNCLWASKGQRARMGSLFRGGSSLADCSARNLSAIYDVMNRYVNYGGTLQALIDPLFTGNYDVHLEPVPPAEKNPIDLGLPSGLKWAQANLGAKKETDPGLYYMWGDTEGHKKDSGYEFTPANYNAKGLNNISADLTLAQDAANVRLGGSWRMPTQEEFRELRDNTNVTWTTINGVAGYTFANKTDASKYIFMPAAGYGWSSSIKNWNRLGYYWSSSLLNPPDSILGAYGFFFDSSGVNGMGPGNGNRNCGYQVRGVLRE